MNFKFINLTLFLNLLFILANTQAGTASNFVITSEETIIQEKPFTGELGASFDWQRISFNFTDVLNINEGDITVYWQDELPPSASTEGDKYSVGFRYAENEPVCWNGGDVRDSANIVAKVNGSCPDTHKNMVDEDAEVKTFIRPFSPTNPGNSYYTLHQDQGFGGIDPIGIGLQIPHNVDTYKMTLSLIDENTIGATTFYWNLAEPKWQELDVFNLSSTQKNLLGVENLSSSLPLPLTYTQELATIEGIDIQFRRPGTIIKDLLITQAKSSQIPSNAIPASVPESSNLIGLFISIGLLGLTTQKSWHKQKI